jgi:hypothetical protein
MLKFSAVRFDGGNAPESVITCTGLADSPSVIHNSMDGVGEVFCSEEVASIGINTTLYKDSRIAAGSDDGCVDNAACAGEASVSCKAGDGNHEWKTTMTGTVVFPPGYVPHSETKGAASATVKIYC